MRTSLSELALGGFEEAFDQSARRRIAHAAVDQSDVQRAAGRLEGMGMVDLGVIQVQLVAGPVNAPGPQQRVFEDIQVFAKIIAGLGHVAAVAVDEGREVGGHRLIPLQHAGPVLEIAQPQGVGEVPRPTPPNLLPAHTQFQPRGPGPLQMPIEGRFGDCGVELGLQELVDGHVRPAGLLLFQFDRLGDHGRRGLAGLAAVLTPLAEEPLETAVAVLLPLPPHRGPRRAAPLAVGEEMLGGGQLVQKGTGLFRRNLSVEQRPQQRTPENSPLFLPVGHGRRSFPHVDLVRRGV